MGLKIYIPFYVLIKNICFRVNINSIELSTTPEILNC
jgi:hypothetical protein